MLTWKETVGAVAHFKGSRYAITQSTDLDDELEVEILDPDGGVGRGIRQHRGGQGVLRKDGGRDRLIPARSTPGLPGAVRRGTRVPQIACRPDLSCGVGTPRSVVLG